jgi:hemolysin activation/secretion protein
MYLYPNLNAVRLHKTWFVLKAVGLLYLGVSTLSNSVWAQVSTSAPIQATDEGLRRQEERARQQQQQQQPRADVLIPATSGVGVTSLPVETPCFVISEVETVGKDAQYFPWLKREAEPYLNRCVGVKGLALIASRFDNKLIELGYATTRVALPQQNLQTGRLAIQLQVGRIAEIRIVEIRAAIQGSGDGDHITTTTLQKAPAAPASNSNKPSTASKDSDARWGTWRNAFPIGAGDILNIRQIEQGVEQMKRLPTQTATTRIEPGALPDTSIVIIERTAPDSVLGRIRGGVTVDNSGSKSLGRTQFSGNLALDNALGINDVATASYNTNAEHPRPTRRSYSYSGSYSAPLGSGLMTVTGSQSRFEQIVQGTTARFLSSGESQSSEVRYQQNLWRTASSKFGIQGGVSLRKSKSFLEDVELIVQRRRTINVETGITYKQLIGEASIDTELSYRKGTAWNNAQDDLVNADIDSNNGLTLRPRIWSATLDVSAPFKLGERNWRYEGRFKAQTTSNLTTSSDQISIGSRGSVRGFDGDAVLLAENGWYLHNDFSTAFTLAEQSPWQLMPYVGIDLGRVWGPSEQLLVGQKLAGLALGLKGRYKSLQWDAAVGTPLFRPKHFKTDNFNPYLSLTYAF